MLSAGGTPAVLFYLLDRHALLAMTMVSKHIFLISLTTHATRRAGPGVRPPLQWWGTLFRDGTITNNTELRF